MQTHKDVEIRSQRFRIGLFDALAGSTVVAIILPKVMSVMEHSKLDMGMLLRLLPTLSPSDLKLIQTECLKVCFTFMANSDAPVPIMKFDGTWANKELQFDIVTVLALTGHAIGFNLSPFFQGDGLETIFSSLMGEPSTL